MSVQLTRAQQFVEAQVEYVAHLFNHNGLTKDDLGLVAREVKKHMKRHYGMNEVMLILWGTRFTMQDVADGPASFPEWDRVWTEQGGNPKFSHPKHYLRILAHSILCVEVVSSAAIISSFDDEESALFNLWMERTAQRDKAQGGSVSWDQMSDGVVESMPGPLDHWI